MRTGKYLSCNIGSFSREVLGDDSCVIIFASVYSIHVHSFLFLMSLRTVI